MTYSYECLECGFALDDRYPRHPGCPRCGARLWPTVARRRRRRLVAGAAGHRGEHGSAGLLALILASALGAAGIFSLSPALSHAELISARIELQDAGQQLQISPVATTAQARATLTANDPGLPLSSGEVATRSGLVGITVSPGGAWVLSEVAAGTCVVVSGSATGISESEIRLSTGRRCVA